MSEVTTEAGKRLLTLLRGSPFEADLAAFEAEAREQGCVWATEHKAIAASIRAEARADLARRIEERLRSSDIRDIDDIEAAVAIVREEAAR